MEDKLFKYTNILTLAFMALNLVAATTEKPTPVSFDWWDDTCVLTYEPPQVSGLYKLRVKKKWKRHRVNTKDLANNILMIKHEICSDGIITDSADVHTSLSNSYSKLFGVSYKIYPLRSERADIIDFERYGSTQTCIMTFHSPKFLKKYELTVKKRWRKYKRTSFKHTVIITHPICSDKEWYKHRGMYPTRAANGYIRMFGIKYIRSKGT